MRLLLNYSCEKKVSLCVCFMDYVYECEVVHCVTQLISL